MAKSSPSGQRGCRPLAGISHKIQYFNTVGLSQRREMSSVGLPTCRLFSPWAPALLLPRACLIKLSTARSRHASTVSKARQQGQIRSARSASPLQAGGSGPKNRPRSRGKVRRDFQKDGQGIQSQTIKVPSDGARVVSTSLVRDWRAPTYSNVHRTASCISGFG